MGSLDLLENLRHQLNSLADIETQQSAQRFFKEPVLVYGVKSALVEKLAKDIWKNIKHLSKQDIFGLCGELFASDYCEEAYIAANWSYALRGQYELSDFGLFAGWIESYINNWAKCDTFCNHTMGAFVQQFPGHISRLKLFTKSPNRWVKRAAAVSLIIPARKGLFLQDVFQIADALLLDSDDMVQKGYGWMLKVASQVHQQEVFDYVISHKMSMPRTALRYAIEKMPKELKIEAMEK